MEQLAWFSSSLSQDPHFVSRKIHSRCCSSTMSYVVRTACAEANTWAEAGGDCPSEWKNIFSRGQEIRRPPWSSKQPSSAVTKHLQQRDTTYDQAFHWPDVYSKREVGFSAGNLFFLFDYTIFNLAVTCECFIIWFCTVCPVPKFKKKQKFCPKIEILSKNRKIHSSLVPKPKKQTTWL